MKTRRLRRLSIPLILAATGLAATALAAVPAPTPPAIEASASIEARLLVDRFVGEYRYAGGEKERKARDAAIDDVVREMNAIVRGIARDRLTEANQIAKSLAIVRNGDQVTFTHDGRHYAAAIDGGPVRVESVTGDELSLRYAVKSESIQQVFQGEDGGRTNGYRAGDDSFVMTVRVHSEKLPKDLVYRLSYAR